MLERIKQRLAAFAHGEPGSRFEGRYRRVHATKRNPFHKAFFISLGLFVMAAGVFFLPAPGPGMVIIAIGAAMIAQESLWMARLLDRIEVRGRAAFLRIRENWIAMSLAYRILLLAIIAVGLLGLAYAGYSIVAAWRG